MSERISIPEFTPPSSRQFQARIEQAKTPQERVSLVAEWAMKTGLCNGISPKVYDELLLLRRGVI